MAFLLIAYCLLFAILAWKNFRLALGIFIIALPSYLIRFNIGPLPTTLLELNFGILFLIWILQYARMDWPNIKYLILNNKYFFIALSLFFIASIAGIFISDMWFYSLGQWRAYFLEPMLFFIILVGRSKIFSYLDIIWSLLFSSLSISILAIIQKLTGSLYPPSLWNDQTFDRATSFFTTPNAIGLFLGPIILLGVGLYIHLKQNKATREKLYAAFGITALAILGLLASKSIGGILAVIGGLFALGLFFKQRKILLQTLGVLFAFAIIFIVTPGGKNLIQTKLRSGNNRLILWNHAKTFLTTSPKNFIFGAGIRQYFRKVEKPHYNPKELERLIYPHNIFLNFWSEIGLFGLIAFITIYRYLCIAAYRLYVQSDKFLGAALFSALIALILHGLVDVPYFKNDLAMLFWILAAGVIASEPPTATSGERSNLVVSNTMPEGGGVAPSSVPRSPQ